MKKLTLIVLSFVFTASGCASVRAGLATASAANIQGCRPEELQVSDTYGSNPFAGPSWKATCHQQVYECSGYMQIASSVKCHPIAN
jgi:hypothetical protein